METGTYALEPDPIGGLRVAIAPGDVRGVRYLLERCGGFCCGLDGRDGPNLGCVSCGRPVATRIDDCSLWQVIWLDPGAVRPSGDEAPVSDWAALPAERPGIPPVDSRGEWDPRWSAAVGSALGFLLLASGGGAVVVPHGLLADVFRRSLDTLLPDRGRLRSSVLGLAGPGVPAAGADIVLVPEHPQTGLWWDEHEAAAAVPIAWDVWNVLAVEGGRRVVAVPDEVWRDDPPPPPAGYRFRADSRSFRRVLAGRAEMRWPWLREIYDRYGTCPYHDPF